MALKTKKYLYDVIDSDVSSKVTSSSKSGSTYAGSVVTWEQFCDDGENIADITINGVTQNVYAPEGGGGGSTVVVTPTVTSGTKLADISVDSVISSIFAPSVSAAASLASGTDIGTITVGGNTTTFKAPTPTSVSVNRKTTSGTNIADITINGTTTQLYAPNSGGGGVSSVVVNPIVTSGTNIATINVDGTLTAIKAPTIPTITASQIATSGTNIGKININGTETVFKAPTTSVTTYVGSGTHIADIVADGTTKALYAPTASVTWQADPLIPTVTPYIIGDFMTHWWVGSICYVEVDSSHRYWVIATYSTNQTGNPGWGYLWWFKYADGSFVRYQKTLVHHANAMCYDTVNKKLYLAPAYDGTGSSRLSMNCVYQFSLSLNSTDNEYQVSNTDEPESFDGPSGWTCVAAVSYDNATNKLWVYSGYQVAYRTGTGNPTAWTLKGSISTLNDIGWQDMAVHANMAYIGSNRNAYRLYDLSGSSPQYIKYSGIHNYDSFNVDRMGELEGWEFAYISGVPYLIASGVNYEHGGDTTGGAAWSRNDGWNRGSVWIIPTQWSSGGNWVDWPANKTYNQLQNGPADTVYLQPNGPGSCLYSNFTDIKHLCQLTDRIHKPSVIVVDGSVQATFDMTVCRLISYGDVTIQLKNNAVLKFNQLQLYGTHLSIFGTGSIRFPNHSTYVYDVTMDASSSIDIGYYPYFPDGLVIKQLHDGYQHVAFMAKPTTDGSTLATTQLISTGGTTRTITGACTYQGTAAMAYANHTHSIANVTNLQSTLDGKASTSHTHTKSQITDLVNASVTQDSSTGDITLEGIVAGSGSVGSTTWGNITGTLSNQTDLNSALAGKAASTHTHTRSQITDLPIQSGYASATIEAGSLYVDGSVTFATPFASRPHVQLSTYTATTSAEGVVIFVLTSVTNTGFTYRGWRITSTSSSLRAPAMWWLAIGTESMS